MIEQDESLGVEGNARLTGMTGAVLLVALAVEGFTVIDVRQMLVVHLFVGLLLVPVTLLKLGSTGWRFWHYYRGEERYRRKGPPHPVLRVLAPLVVLASVALLGTGVGLLIVGPAHSQPLRDIHQATFIAWFALMTVHVLGHLLETYHLGLADVRSTEGPRPTGAGARRGLVAASLLLGLGLGAASLHWNHDWRTQPRGRRDGRVVTAPPVSAP